MKTTTNLTLYKEEVTCRLAGSQDLSWVKDLQFRTHEGRSMEISHLKSYLNSSEKQLVIASAKNVNLGYMMLKILGPSYRIVDIATEPSYQRMGIASAMLDPLIKSSFALSAISRDTCLAGQLLLRHHGFYCLRIVKSYFTTPQADGYYFWRVSNG